MPALLFDLVQRLIGVLEDALAGVLAVGKGHAHAQRNSGQTVRRVEQRVVDDFDLVADGIAQPPVHVHHDDRDIKGTHTLYSNSFQRQSGLPPEISTEFQIILYIMYTSIPKIPPHCNQIALGISSKIV